MMGARRPRTVVLCARARPGSRVVVFVPVISGRRSPPMFGDLRNKYGFGFFPSRAFSLVLRLFATCRPTCAEWDGQRDCVNNRSNIVMTYCRSLGVLLSKAAPSAAVLFWASSSRPELDDSSSSVRPPSFAAAADAAAASSSGCCTVRRFLPSCFNFFFTSVRLLPGCAQPARLCPRFCKSRVGRGRGRETSCVRWLRSV